MTIHLIRTEGFHQEQYNEVVEFLQSFDGPIQFVSGGLSPGFIEKEISVVPVDKKKFTRQDPIALNSYYYAPSFRPETSWKILFGLCQKYRKDRDLPQSDLVILLTDIANNHNWFSAFDPSHRYDGFVHTSEWEHYVLCSEVFPVAYQVVSLVLQKHMFSDMQSLKKAAHEVPLGCINDFCEHKREIILKLRTADVCLDCMHLLKDKLKPLEIQQMLSIFEGVRLRILFNQNFRQNLKPSRLQVTRQCKILLPDFGNLEIKLTPLEKTLYLFFLQHPEGIMLYDLVDHKEELKRIYSRISTSGLLTEIHNRIDGLVNVNSNSANEKISKIKSAFVRAIGKELAGHYYIQGDHSEKKLVPLERELYFREFE